MCICIYAYTLVSDLSIYPSVQIYLYLSISPSLYIYIHIERGRCKGMRPCREPVDQGQKHIYIYIYIYINIYVYMFMFIYKYLYTLVSDLSIHPSV